MYGQNERRQVKREIFCVWNVSLCVLAVAVGMRVFGMFIPRTPGLWSLKHTVSVELAN